MYDGLTVTIIETQSILERKDFLTMKISTFS